MVEIRTANHLKDLEQLLVSGGDISIAVAYLTRSGLEEIERELFKAVDKGHHVRMVVDLSSGITEPDTLRELVRRSCDDRDNFGFRAFFSTKGTVIFHGKVYIAHSRKKNFITFLTGSYNLTGAALHRNLEHGLLVKCDWKDDVGRETLKEFSKVWGNQLATALDDKAIRLYTEFRGETRKTRENSRRVRNSRKALADYLSQKNNPVGSGYWLIKCNVSRPYVTIPKRKFYKFSDLLVAPDKTDYWGNELDNSQARNYLECDMEVGDEVLFYHSGISRPEIVGVASGPTALKRWVKLSGAKCNPGFVGKLDKLNYPSLQSFRTTRVTRSAYCSPDASGKKVVDIRATQKFVPPITLEQIKGTFSLQEMKLVRGSTRLSVQPVRSEEWEGILKMADLKPVSTD